LTNTTRKEYETRISGKEREIEEENKKEETFVRLK
jgi:hypothetical protein